MLTMTDRRNSLRIKTSMAARCGGQQATLLNLSPSGARLVMGSDFESAQRLTLEFVICGRRFRLAVEVSWRERLGTSTVIGVRYLDIGEVEQHELRNHVIRSHYGLSIAA